MKIITNKENLLKAIITADSIISSKNVNTILANCFFKISKTNIEIISTDNEIAVKSKLNVESDGETEFIANGKKFLELLKEMPNDDIILEINDNKLIDVKTKSKSIMGSYKFIGAISEEYPEINTSIENNAIEIEQSILKDMIKKVIYAASTDTIKPVFNGIYFISEQKGSLTAVSTDSRRLSVITRKIENEINIEEGIIIPLKTIHEIYRTLEGSGICRFAFNKKQCAIKIGETEILSRITDGQFPNYKQVIPKDHVLSAIINTKNLYASIKRSIVFTKEPANKIILNFNNNKLTIEANAPELGESVEEVEILNDNNINISLGINSHFLIDALKEIESSNVICAITGQMSPVKLSSENDKNHISIIMPLQIK